MKWSHKLHQAKSFVAYKFKAKRLEGVHSPFVFSLSKHIRETRFSSPLVKAYRNAILADSTSVEKRDFGTGQSKPVQVKQMAASSSISKKYGALLAKLVLFFSPKKVLELGTCLGMSTVYFSEALTSSSQLITVEGCSETFKRVRKHFSEQKILDAKRLKTIQADFDSFLNENEDEFELVFIDGNHSYEATLRYFDILWPRIPEGGVLILDDIYWSPDMTDAWRELSAKKDVDCSIDLFQFGLLCKRQQAKEHFIIAY